MTRGGRGPEGDRPRPLASRWRRQPGRASPEGSTAEDNLERLREYDRGRDKYAREDPYVRKKRRSPNGRRNRDKVLAARRRASRPPGSTPRRVRRGSRPETCYRMHGGRCGICGEFIDGAFHVDHGGRCRGGKRPINCQPARELQPAKERQVASSDVDRLRQLAPSRTRRRPAGYFADLRGKMVHPRPSRKSLNVTRASRVLCCGRRWGRRKSPPRLRSARPASRTR